MNRDTAACIEFSTTALLLDRIKTGDQRAMQDLIESVQPPLTRWAHGRLPYAMKAMYDTHDFVQESLTRALSKIENFQSLRPGAFLAYLRQILLNCINEEFRKREYRSKRVNNDAEFLGTSRFSNDPDLVSLLQYENALDKLKPLEKQAIVLRLEFGLSYLELAEEIGKNSANTARMYVSRALVKLAEHLQ